MTEISFLEPDEVIRVDDKQVDNFVAYLENEGMVQSQADSFAPVEKVAPEAKLSERAIGPWEFQFGFHNNDYVFSFWPLQGGLQIGEKIEKRTNPIILAIIKVLSDVIPDTMRVNIFKPSQFVDVKVFTVKVIDARGSLVFDAERVEALFLAIAQEAHKAFK